MKKSTLLAFTLLIFVGLMATDVPGQDSGCVKCHTDEATMKSLVLPPKTAAGSGEG